MEVHASRPLVFHPIPGLGLVEKGTALAEEIDAVFRRLGFVLCDGDIVVVASTAVARAEGRMVDLSTIAPSPRAQSLAERTGKDAAWVELVLRESDHVVRAAPGVLITRHRLGFVSANAGVDRSNARPLDSSSDAGGWAVCLPLDPDRSASELCRALSQRAGVSLGVIVSDSFGRPFRRGSVGVALGVSGTCAVVDRCGQRDLQGRALVASWTADADALAAGADVVMGQADEGVAIVVVRGYISRAATGRGADLLRPRERDLFGTEWTDA